jgi:hypothetical protein
MYRHRSELLARGQGLPNETQPTGAAVSVSGSSMLPAAPTAEP